ncbi:uncharacterized protein N7515_006282 [Penicillium bovifimosum]|uniref:Uncharacterized protein n=1 Tax=Penicillium bovifimosum TaxID=126998 RepID=A0A9W9GUN7_9EURO|nr:uncharacterized protein N7515_006282 [Penicillium bovifimosum]KAJ5130243.1 hypothetical protein N7515_006282 [Penicillium bovifimosum]
MARSTAGTSGRPSILLLLTLVASIRPGQAFDSIGLLPRSDTCPSTYTRCSSTKLPNDFCCPSGSTCISLDEASSAICCPAGEVCDYITPITCDIQRQNATLYPESAIKTLRLSDSLPKCGDACCPFGYSCQGGNTCALIEKASTTSTATGSGSSTSTTSPSTTTTGGSTTPLTTITPVSSSSSEKSTLPTASAGHLATSCPSFPGGAVAAGFFPGAVFGAVAALLISLCLRRRARKNETEIQEGRSRPHWSQRSSSGTLLGISNPIPQDDTSYRTDFLRSPPRARRSSMGGRSTRSMIHRTGTRVRSLFSGYPRQDPRLDGDIPPVPMPPDPITPPRQRQQSTESIKVYSPPGVYSQSRNALGPEPYPRTAARPETTFSDLMNVAGIPQGRKGAPYPTGEEFRENPFRDPGR